MNRHYYVTDNLDDVEIVEQELESSGINSEQIHLLSERDAEVDHHKHLHEVTSFMKNDAVHSGEIGAVIGVALSMLVLGGAYLLGWTETAAGWIPFIFLAVIILGFSTWEGGFLGVQRRNAHFRRFKRLLKSGKHIFFVDVEPEQEEVVERVVERHPLLKAVGTGEAAPHWLVAWLHRWHQFRRSI
ncbi:magnesium transporter [Marinobacterium arenosum]|uniref:magnesium transporter n=1 Tax=Marinobacterium arenosum TaxID=2862496 RepID=UPI001C977EC1|nr:magnesium transporter [Marinobacterium arenosum]MBY4675324.1 magnesium transporter [Marinobacterium arenosum]